MISNQFNLKLFKASVLTALTFVCCSSFSEPMWAQVSGNTFKLIETQKENSDLGNTGQSEPGHRSSGGTYARDWDFERDGQSQPENLTRGGSQWDFDEDGQPRSGERNSGGSRGHVILDNPTPGSRTPSDDDSCAIDNDPTRESYAPSDDDSCAIDNDPTRESHAPSDDDSCAIDNDRATRGSQAPSDNDSCAIDNDSCAIDNRSLTALVPKINLGLTTESHPTFWFYIPDEMASVDEAKFTLLDKENNPIIYELSIELSETSGFVSVSLPATAKSLEVDREYHWFFDLQYNGSPSSNPSVHGWIQRVEPDPILASELDETPDTEDYVIYANHGIWYDALTELIEQYRTQEENPILEAHWLALLEAVCLEEISATPE